jgi:hypothetical protein
MHHALMIVSRVLAGLVAAMAFYLSFFLYPNEEGIWANRIDDLWVSVHNCADLLQ